MSDISGVDPTVPAPAPQEDFGGGSDSTPISGSSSGGISWSFGSVANTIGNIATGGASAATSIGAGLNQLFGSSSKAPSWTWGQLFGNVGLIILGIVLIGVSLAVGSHETVIKVTKDSLK